MQTDREGFKYPVVDSNACIECRICEKNCVVVTASKNKCRGNYPLFFAAQASNEAVVFNSSSGGVFTLLAEYIIDNRGAVAGASFSETLDVVHIIIEEKKDIHHLQGSKYVQSDLLKTFVQTRILLEDGRFVLFSGTSCQIEGLRNYLNKSYDNLFLVDLICHGVPMPKLWRKYLQYQENKFKSEIQYANFREKTTGWLSYNMHLKFTDSKEYKKKVAEEPYMRLFLSNYFLRESCYDCKFKNLDKPSDITLSDFWEIKYAFPELDDDKGLSLVFVNTEKGRLLFDHVNKKMKCYQTTKEKALFNNPTVLKSSLRPVKRNEIVGQIDEISFKELLKKSCVPLWRDKYRRLKNRIRNK